MSLYDPFEEFEEAYEDETGRFTDRKLLQLLLRCVEESVAYKKPLSNAVERALSDHMEALLHGQQSWLLRPMDKREHTEGVVSAKATAVVYVEEYPDKKKAVAKLYGISVRTLNRWMKRYPGGGTEWIYGDDIEDCAQIYKRAR